MLFGPGFMQRIIFAFVVLQLLSLVFDGLWLGATDMGVLKTMTYFESKELFGWALPLAYLAGFIASLPQMLVWDYAWFTSLGNFGSMLRLILASITLFGFVWGFVTMLWPIIAQLILAVVRGASGLIGGIAGRFF